MKNLFFFIVCIYAQLVATAQPLTQRLAEAFKAFEADEQMKYGIAALVVKDASNGQVIFQKNQRLGLAPASTLKVVTSAAAFELLGKDFRYHTQIGVGSGHKPSLVIKPSGDPTFGSWRWKHTTTDQLMNRIVKAVMATGIKEFSGLAIEDQGWQQETIPAGWIWEDIANYYGAGAEALNWRENQYDLILSSGPRRGDPVTVVRTEPELHWYQIRSAAFAGAAGSGDNAYIYFPVGRQEALVRGTIPPGEKQFRISGAFPNARFQFENTLKEALMKAGIIVGSLHAQAGAPVKWIHTETSPALDSISYWFLRRSINLYGEALLKTIAAASGEDASTANGVAQLKKFWKEKAGIEAAAMNIFDGSGLSPLNRITAEAEVDVLLWAHGRPWYSSYREGFPEFNGMRMKSGTINSVKGYTGYHRSSNGKEYAFAMLVNNYSGSGSALVQKMYRVLNNLK